MWLVLKGKFRILDIRACLSLPLKADFLLHNVDKTLFMALHLKAFGVAAGSGGLISPTAAEKIVPQNMTIYGIQGDVYFEIISANSL